MKFIKKVICRFKGHQFHTLHKSFSLEVKQCERCGICRNILSENETPISYFDSTKEQSVLKYIENDPILNKSRYEE